MVSTTSNRMSGADRRADLHSSGMRDLGPDEMRRFRAVEGRFLAIATEQGYEEIRTPTIEPLHLFTGAGTLAPQLLDRVYSFLDWDGWSGERVVLRPDSTVPAARWFEQDAESKVARLCYVQPVYRFAGGEAEREVWQCGVELFGIGANEGDPELLRLALDVVSSLGLQELQVELGHAALLRSVVEAADLDDGQRLLLLDELIEGEGERSEIERLAGLVPPLASALEVLFDSGGGGDGSYLANLRAALEPALPATAVAFDELEAAVEAVSGRASVAVRPTNARGFEYYTGLTFRVATGGRQVLSGGRYDGLGTTAGDREVPASGFGADLLLLGSLLEMETGTGE